MLACNDDRVEDVGGPVSPSADQSQKGGGSEIGIREEVYSIAGKTWHHKESRSRFLYREDQHATPTMTQTDRWNRYVIWQVNGGDLQST